MTYTQAVFHETLRLYPSVPKDLVTSVEEDVLPCGTRVPPNTWVAFLPYVMGRDETLWPEASSFKPERWIQDGRLIKESPFKFPAFKAGPRICLGMNMANLEACSVLACIYSKFSIKVTPGQNITYRNSVTIPMLNGMN